MSVKPTESAVLVDRLLVVSSLILVVLTVIFSQFMDAEKFWQGKAVDIEMLLLGKGVDAHARPEMERKIREFDGYHHEQKKYGGVFAALMGTIVWITALCLPIGAWRDATRLLRVVTAIFMVCLVFLGVLGWAFFLERWRP